MMTNYHKVIALPYYKKTASREAEKMNLIRCNQGAVGLTREPPTQFVLTTKTKKIF